MNCCAIFGLFQLVCVMVLHLTFVSNGSCLIKVMETRDFSSSQVVTNGTLSPLPSYFLRDDEILNIQIQHSTDKTTSKIYNVSDPSSDYNPTYRFSTSQAVMYLSPTFKDMHEVNHVNITLTDVCLATGEIEVPGAEPQLSAIQSFAISLSNFYGYDTAIINQLMYGMKGMSDFRGFSAGFIQSFRTGEYWSWRPTLMLLGKDLGVVEFLLYKFVVVLNAVVAYFLISAATALIVRVLTSSGVVIMFFVFKCLRILGAGAGANDRVLSLSYPWIGREIDSAEITQTHPKNHLLCAHIGKVVLFYSLYEACQTVFSGWLYNKSIPEGLGVSMFGLVMVWEYFSMVFVRSAASVLFFPKVIAIYFVGYHIYFYSVGYGYFGMMLGPLFCFSCHAMFYCVMVLEVPALNKGSVSLECPREVFTRMSWPAFTSSLPHDWTIFMPLNSRYIPINDMEVEGEGEDEDEGEEIDEESDEESDEDEL